jgi:hypothetical protein
MKPRTRTQIKVAGLSSKLRPVTSKHEAWAYEKCLDKYCVRSRKTLFCLECGHSWKDEAVLVTCIAGCTCPLCGRDLKLKASYDRYYRESAYFAILTTKEDMQVVRMFYACKIMKKLNKAECFVQEVMQHWVDDKGNVTTMSKNVQGLSHYYDQWIFYSPLQVRPRSYKSCPRYSISPYKVYPGMKVLPVIKRNGFKGHFHEYAPHHLFSTILQFSRAETLLKTGQVELLKYFDKHPGYINDYWQNIKICIRNNFKIADPSTWFDYLCLLEHSGKDLNSSKYVCPADVKLAHDRLVIKKREQDRKLRLSQLRERIAQEQEEFEKQKGKFFNIQFTDGEILVKALRTVEEYMIEGDILNHCIFTNEYYKKDNSLILSARVNNAPVETIELSLDNFSVVQSRGINNQITQYHDRIVNLVNENIKNQVARCA